VSSSYRQSRRELLQDFTLDFGVTDILVCFGRGFCLIESESGHAGEVSEPTRYSFMSRRSYEWKELHNRCPANSVYIYIYIYIYMYVYTISD
jgi:hypothetical protein